MNNPPRPGLGYFLLGSMLIHLMLGGCASPPPPEKEIVKVPEKMDTRVTKDIRKLIKFTIDNRAYLNDTTRLFQDSLTGWVFERNDYRPMWSSNEYWLPMADSLVYFLDHSKEYGLFAADYHYKAIMGSRELLTDSAARTDAMNWSRAELLMTDALINLGRDLKKGRLQFDSVTLRTDTLLPPEFYWTLLQDVKKTRGISGVLRNLEPKNSRYDSLKVGLKHFLDSVGTFRRYTYLNYPAADRVAFYKQLEKRLFEEDIIVSPSAELDSAAWMSLLSAYQKDHNLKVTGKINEATVNTLNRTSWEMFKNIAVNLDRYKLLPDSLPERYLWVNIPAYYLELRDSDTVAIRSKIVVGKPITRTPLLTSAITNLVTYPQWTIPASIVEKEIIPGMKKDSAYLKKHGYVLINNDGQEVDPHTLHWKRYKKEIPYKVIQGSGDDNALGVLKFNFNNRYSVYLHDTNQRYYFGKSDRALSHGCVRVQQWQKLAFYLLRQDSLSAVMNRSKYSTIDSVKAWLKRKEKHTVFLKNRMPLLIRYFSCEGVDGRVKFYDDVYAEDRLLREKYFAEKQVQ